MRNLYRRFTPSSCYFLFLLFGIIGNSRQQEVSIQDPGKNENLKDSSGTGSAGVCADGDYETGAVCLRCAAAKAITSVAECCQRTEIFELCVALINEEDNNVIFGDNYNDAADKNWYRPEDKRIAGNEEVDEYDEDEEDEDDEEELMDLHEVREDKRKSPFLGKRRSPFLGKRRSPFLGKRRSPFLGKRRGPFLGKRGSPFLGKRRSPFLGKRNPFSGKRTSPFLGKREA